MGPATARATEVAGAIGGPFGYPNAGPRRRALPGQLRAAAHTDFGALTLLMPEDKPGGLQICGRDGEWLDVPAPAGVYVVDIGDMMAQWTNHAWVSTLHRVTNPPDGADPVARRQSLLFFQIPNFDAAIDCIPTCIDTAQPRRHADRRRRLLSCQGGANAQSRGGLSRMVAAETSSWLGGSACRIKAGT
jgi:isopenicillin N synthase-like dioxygenase